MTELKIEATPFILEIRLAKNVYLLSHTNGMCTPVESSELTRRNKALQITSVCREIYLPVVEPGTVYCTFPTALNSEND